MTRYVKFKAPHLPSFDFRVLQMICIWQNIIKLSLSSWWMWLEMGNRMIYMDFEFQTLHAIWSSFFWLKGPPDVLYLKKYYKFLIWNTLWINWGVYCLKKQIILPYTEISLWASETDKKSFRSIHHLPIYTDTDSNRFLGLLTLPIPIFRNE